MIILLAICNIYLFLFTLLILATDGLPKQVGYILTTLLVLLTPILSLMVIALNRKKRSRLELLIENISLMKKGEIERKYTNITILKIVVIILNIILFCCVCWSVFQPHQAESGFIPYLILVLITPILNIIVFFRIGTTNRKIN